MSRKPTATQQAPVVMAAPQPLEQLTALLKQHPVILVNGDHNIIGNGVHGNIMLNHQEGSSTEQLLAVIQSQAETIRQLSETISKLALRTVKKQ